MEEVNKQEEQEEVLGYELDEQIDVLLRKIEKIIHQMQVDIRSLTPDTRRDLENLVVLMRSEFENGAVTQAMLDRRKNAEIDAVIEKQIQTGNIPKPSDYYSRSSSVLTKLAGADLWEAWALIHNLLGLLEDRVSDMETRMLGTSLSPRDWEEGEG